MSFSVQAKQHLDQFKVLGKTLTLSYSRIKNLLVGKLIEDEGLQKNYVNSRYIVCSVSESKLQDCRAGAGRSRPFLRGAEAALKNRPAPQICKKWIC